MKKIIAIVISAVLSIAVIIGIGAFSVKQLLKIPEINFTVFAAVNIDDTEGVAAHLSQKTRYYYNQLNEQQKLAYRRFYRAVTNFEPSVKVVLEEQDIEKLFTAIIYDNPELFWLSNEYEYSSFNSCVEYTPNYVYTREESENITARLKAKLDEIMVGAQSLTGDYDKELYFHDYICENAEYDDSEYDTVGSTAYNLFLNGKAACEGYSRAMQMLLDRAGIENYLIVGDGTSGGETEAHMWNVVKIDGMNYHLDVTWDDADGVEETSHLYFNVPDSFIINDHSNLVPSVNNCTSIEANYFYLNNMHITSFSGFSSLSEDCKKLLKSGKRYAEFTFGSQEDYDKALKALKNDYEFFDFVRNVVRGSGQNLSIDEIEYINNDECKYLCIIFKED